jgi:hypothetical protein
VLAIELWVRSYFRIDGIRSRTSSTLVFATSFRRELRILWLGHRTASPANAERTTFRSKPIVPGPNGTKVSYGDGTGRPLPLFLGFKSSWLSAPVGGRGSVLVIPFWFPTVVFGVAASTPLWRSSLRFSLRTLLIATALIAVVVGLVVYATR